jgi:outer membrane protein TolC
MMKLKLNWSLLATFMAGALVGQWIHASAEVTGASTNLLSLDAVVSEVLSNNPALKAARAEWEAMKQRLPQARAWEDLRVGLDVERSGTTRFATFTDNEWMVAQTIPLTGKNRLQGKAAAAEAMAAFEALRRREIELAAKARAAFYRLAEAHQQLRIVDLNVELLRQFVNISRSKYEAGTKPQSDVLVAETDLSKLEESRYDVLRQLSDAQSLLNVLLNRPAQSPLPETEEMRFLTLDLEPDRLGALALGHRPELLMARKKIEAAQARVDVAKRQWIPDPEIRVEARQFNGEGFQEYDTGIFFNFPWLNRKKYKAAIAEAKEMKASAEHELEALQKETLGLVRDALKKVETFHHHVELFGGRIVPLAQQNVTATRLAYETDRTGFLNLIDAQRTLQEVESMYWHHLAEYLTGLAELEAAVGLDLNKIPKP